ncbi:hypothetical protein [Tropicibacter naphthalenivorans]|uniref:Uncharacterized protein n=1 Tax=Tropicibacter naphthalenivorans TaxID=441103 RepID=A0A0P1G8B6_9RHOB|nr:hypothetical protein [Tropicibacter naphthalenivorans]CUH77877.1 hypothetical protein TRN7648_01667 [Tropicibacter naphthalenivorans]SMC95315.1 hypothetical protein SAMN04488093_107174 [Tropicibacter naphthalenivorans]
MQDTEIARVSASAPRRVIGVAAMMGLGALLLYVALATPPSLMWQAFLVVLGIAALWGGQMLWQATGHALILTEEALVDSDGTVVARLEDIAKVDRSPFALKPSNGFLLILKEPSSRVWRPGLWWRTGKRVAVGGVTSGAETKPVADMIALRIAPPMGFDPE